MSQEGERSGSTESQPPSNGNLYRQKRALLRCF